MTEPVSDEDLKVLKTIEDKIFSSINLGVDLSEFDILDDVNTSKSAIQELGVKIAVNNTELSVTILEIAHSIYFGHSLQGGTPDFFDAVIRLGSDRIKLLVFSLSLFSLSKGLEARRRVAKSASIGILGKIIAEQMNLKEDCIRKIETGGLLSQLGKNILINARELGVNLRDDFIEQHEMTLAVNIIDRLKLDAFLKKAIDMSVADFDEESFSLVGVIKLAEALTEDSFRKYGKLVLKSPMPDTNKVLVRTPGSDIRKLFEALGVDDFLVIEEVPTQQQKNAAAKQAKPRKK